MSNTTIQKQSLTDLLTKRIDAWNQIDRLYDEGLFVKALKLTQYVENILTPKIRGEYGL